MRQRGRRETQNRFALQPRGLVFMVQIQQQCEISVVGLIKLLGHRKAHPRGRLPVDVFSAIAGTPFSYRVKFVFLKPATSHLGLTSRFHRIDSAFPGRIQFPEWRCNIDRIFFTQRNAACDESKWKRRLQFSRSDVVLSATGKEALVGHDARVELRNVLKTYVSVVVVVFSSLQHRFNFVCNRLNQPAQQTRRSFNTGLLVQAISQDQVSCRESSAFVVAGPGNVHWSLGVAMFRNNSLCRKGPKIGNANAPVKNQWRQKHSRCQNQEANVSQNGTDGDKANDDDVDPTFRSQSAVSHVRFFLSGHQLPSINCLQLVRQRLPRKNLNDRGFRLFTPGSLKSTAQLNSVWKNMQRQCSGVIRDRVVASIKKRHRL